MREVQNGELAKQVANGDPRNAENLIFKVLEQRHMRERAEQEEQFSREMDIARAELRADVEENRQAEREELIAQQEKVPVGVFLTMFMFESVVYLVAIKIDFHSVRFSDRAGNLLSTREDIALKLNRKLCLNDLLFMVQNSVCSENPIE